MNNNNGKGTWCVDMVIRKSKKGFSISMVSFGKWAAEGGEHVWQDGLPSVGAARAAIVKSFGDHMPKVIDET